MQMKTNLGFLTKLTVGGLVTVAVALWMQWLSGDPAYPKFPPGPVLFIGVAAIVVFGARWWWTPLIGSLIALLTTSGWFVRLPAEMLRLSHPGQVGKFAAGIFIGTLLQIGGPPTQAVRPGQRAGASASSTTSSLTYTALLPQLH